MDTFTIVPTGTYSLRESVEFGFGQRHSDIFDGVMRLGFCQDDLQHQVGVVVTQDEAGVHGEVHGGSGDIDAISVQVARVLSLDQDASGFADVGARDPVIGALQKAAPGLLPPLFHSPYEAAVWSVLSARRPAKQMAEVRRRLSEAHGQVFELAGKPLAALPTPERLLRIVEFPGLPPDKLDRMHGVARAALDGLLDVGRLQALGPEVAARELQAINGIGPFYASLITIRATGFTDVLPADEPMALDLITQLYGLAKPCTPETFREIAEPWKPYRTWATVLVRAAGHRIL
ncbi:DNA-3-methyladenine glycosylase II [Nakamurella sp. UYEF19]|uniref:DNA-3-methyladenine glycosylase family protein n=1 Tax=Nakamurella sp. UYEF19 TaxID=1756392 RepID=UPI0033955963